MNIFVNDVLEMKKPHPCGNGMKDERSSSMFTVLRVGADIKIKCGNCGHEIMSPRVKIEKNIVRINGEKITK